MTDFPTFELFKRDGTRIEFTSAFARDLDVVAFMADRLDRISDFAKDLLRKRNDRPLTDVQWGWLHKLATDQKARELDPTPRRGFVAAELPGLVALLVKAAQAGKKFPKLRLNTEAHGPIALSLAGDRAKVPGSVNVTNGGPYGDNVWFGRITPDGAWNPARNTDADITRILIDLNADPAKVAGQHGVATGVCCFCSRELSDARSRTVGYGPICAEKFGLPWGDTTAADEADKEARAEIKADAEVEAAPGQSQHDALFLATSKGVHPDLAEVFIKDAAGDYDKAGRDLDAYLAWKADAVAKVNRGHNNGYPSSEHVFGND